jgi:hypothetical protein
MPPATVIEGAPVQLLPSAPFFPSSPEQATYIRAAAAILTIAAALNRTLFIKNLHD